MRGLLSRASLYIAAAALAAVLVTWLSSGDALEGIATIGEPSGGPLGSLGRSTGRLGAAVLALSAPALLLLCALGAVLAGSRSVDRHRRRYARLALTPPHGNEATPAQVQDLLESLHQRLARRWHRRLLGGQESMALIVGSEPSDGAPPQLWLELVCPQAMAERVEGALRGAYPDARLTRSESRPQTPPAILRLKKRHVFIRRLRTPQDYDPPPIDAVLGQLAAIAPPASLQYVLTPAPALFDRLARRLFRAEEERLERAQLRGGGNPGLRSELAGQELEGGLTLQHNRLFFAEIRIGAQSHGEARDLAAALQGRSGAENQLQARRMLAGRGRFERAIGDMVPDMRCGVLSSAEVSGLWQLPSAGLTGVSLARSALPRAIAPPQACRDRARAIVCDEHGPVGLRASERFAGVAITGAQGTGKTSAMCSLLRGDAEDREGVLVLLDPNAGLAERALGLVPRDRVVHYLDPLAPELGLNPLLAPWDPPTIANAAVEAIKDLFEEGDLHASSERLIRLATLAVVGAHRLGALAGAPSFWHVARLLLPDEDAFRARISRAIETSENYYEAAQYFGRTLPTQLKKATSAFLQRLEAPSNKLQQVNQSQLDRVFRHPRPLSLDDLVERREVLIVNGRMGDFGVASCRMLMQIVLNSLYNALRRQRERPESERVKVRLHVDEMHLILNPSFADALATLRQAGLEVVGAWQYAEQVQDPKIRGGLTSLLGNRLIFRMSEPEEAREASRLVAATYSDQVRADPDSRARVRFAPDTLFRLPDHHAVCSLIAQGQRRPAFIGETFAMDSDPSLRAHHREAQRERGGFVPEALPHPFAEGEPAVAGAAVAAAPAREGEGRAREAVASGVAGGSLGGSADGGEHAGERVTTAPRRGGSDAGDGARRTANGRGSQPSWSASEMLEEHRRRYGAAASVGDRPAPATDARGASRPRTKPRLWGEEEPREEDEGGHLGAPTVPEARRSTGSPDEAGAEEARLEAATEEAAPAEVLWSRIAALERELEEAREERSVGRAKPVEERPDSSEGVTAEAVTSPIDGTRGGVAGAAQGDGRAGLPRSRALAHGGKASSGHGRFTAPHRGSSAAAVPESYTELDFDDVSGLDWERLTNQPKRIEAKPEHLEALAALHRLRLAYGSQLRRLCWPRASDTTMKRRLRELFDAGWADRGHLRRKGRGGGQQRFYSLSEAGFELVRASPGARRPYIREGATWKATRLEGHKTAIHDLHVAGWLVAFDRIAGHLVRDWYGEPHGEVAPQRLVRDRWTQIHAEDVELDSDRALRGLKLERFAAIKPDLTIELRLPSDPPRRLDLLVELDRSRDPTTDHNVRKFRRHDALLTAWSRVHPRYRGHGEPPIVVFVLEDEPTARRFLKRADAEVTGAIARIGTGEETWEYPGRRGMVFCCERDVHMGTLRGWRLPEFPSRVRGRGRGRRGGGVRVEPEEVEVLEGAVVGAA